MLADHLNVRVGNDRRKKAAAALLAQMQAQHPGGQSNPGAVGVRQSGGLARAGARAGMLRGSGRMMPLPPGLAGQAAQFAQANQIGDFSLNAEQQAGAYDPGVAAGGYAAANDPAQGASSVGAGGGSAAGTPSAAGGGAGPGSTPITPEQQAVASNTDPGWLGAVDNPGGGMISYGGGAAPAAAPAAGAGGPIADGTPMNGGIYYQGTIIPMGVWRSLQLG